MKNIYKVGLVYVLIDELKGLQRVSNKLMKRPKLGLEYISASLAEINIDSELYDQQILNFNCDTLIRYLLKDRADLLGFYVCTDNIKSILEYVSIIRKNLSIPIIAGGPGASIYAKELIEAGCKMICIGEGEFTIKDIIYYYQGERKIKIEDIKGIAYADSDNCVILSLPRQLISELDSLPVIRRDKRYFGRYNNHFLYTIKKPYIAMMTSRGCIYKCAFCTSYAFWNNTYRQRSVENVIYEIEDNIRIHNIKYIEFLDDVFAQDIHWLEKFCNALRKKEFDLKWMCLLHPLSFKGNKRKAFRMMSNAGCNAISFGAQSMNKKTLVNINRNPQEPEELRESIYYSKLNNITTILTFILGLPGDNLETIQENHKFCIETKPHLVDFHPLRVIKSSAIDQGYKTVRFTELSDSELNRLSHIYMRKYYTNPTIILQLLKDISAKNPEWILDFLKCSPYFFRFLL